jgi:hypothetical protein
LVALEIGLQFAPALSQRSQANVKLIGVVPDQVPVPATSVCPFAAVPVIVGGDVLLGAASERAELLRGRRSAIAAAVHTAVAAITAPHVVLPRLASFLLLLIR